MNFQTEINGYISNLENYYANYVEVSTLGADFLQNLVLTFSSFDYFP